MIDRRTVLVWLLRGLGGVAALALPTVFLPVSWMASVHEWLGMGRFPESGLVDYLARSLSMFYGLIGLLFLVMATDVERFAPIIRYAGWGSIAAGFMLTGIGLHSGIPKWWSYHEGPTSLVIGVAILWLLGSVPRR